jgi:hypothetical protein
LRKKSSYWWGVLGGVILGYFGGFFGLQGEYGRSIFDELVDGIDLMDYNSKSKDSAFKEG